MAGRDPDFAEHLHEHRIMFSRAGKVKFALLVVADWSKELSVGNLGDLIMDWYRVQSL